ncbi:cellulose synthase-like protein D3 [Cinnamomum micranthum f. kanehirae]|uniref:Cellulose synthase-like protein D3 n=1 Tax=Cinnamomum micranthum f. kanehirae TaxID=337451 RepID=A0A3S3PDQ3_9MAGN|nr:cellulose synthase-like protein D3 [Cinnamomum micranthum f. kanehirae]
MQFNAREEMKKLKQMRDTGADMLLETVKIQKATWMRWDPLARDVANPGPDHKKGDHPGFIQKAGAMNALVRASAILSNGPFMLNLDCDHYINNCQALREGMCFMLDRGSCVCRDGLPVRRFALYGFDPPRSKEYTGLLGMKKKVQTAPHADSENQASGADEFDAELNVAMVPKRFGNSTVLAQSIPVAEYQARPLADHPGITHGRPPGALRIPREPLDASTVAEAVSLISCWYEDKTEWGDRVGWIYGSVTEDVVTGYRMHNRGWRSVYCITKRDAFLGSAPINLTDRLHQVLRWATGSVEIFFSRNNAFFASRKMKVLQRLAYLNVGIYPFTSPFLLVYCFLPALSLFSGKFIVQTLNVTFLVYLLIITSTLMGLAVLELKWSGISLEEWWRNEQFWLISGTSAHLAAVVQGLLKVMAGIEISFTLTSKSAGDDSDDIYAELYLVKWTSLMIPPSPL